MLRPLVFSALILCVHSAPGNLPTVLSPFTITPSVEILQSPVTKVETISISPTYTKTIAPVQKIDSYSSGDSSNAEIRDLLRSLLSEIRSGKSVTTLSAPSSSYFAPDSYSVPPRNTISDYNAPSYPDSVDSKRSKPEKVVVLQEKQISPVVTTAALVETEPVVKEYVRTVYQPVYVPVQYSQPQEYVTVSQPVAQPVSVQTGASAVAISTIHNTPGVAYKQQQVSVPVVQQLQSYPVTLTSPGTLLDAYKKRK